MKISITHRVKPQSGRDPSSRPVLVRKAFDKPPRDKGCAEREREREIRWTFRDSKWPLMMWAAFIPCKEDSRDGRGERNHISSSTETGVFIGILYQGRVTKSRSKMWLMGKRRRGEPQKRAVCRTKDTRMIIFMKKYNFWRGRLRTLGPLDF